MVGISHAELFAKVLVNYIYLPFQPRLGTTLLLGFKILLSTCPCQKSSFQVLRKQGGLIISGSSGAANTDDCWKKKERQNTGKAFHSRSFTKYKPG